MSLLLLPVFGPELLPDVFVVHRLIHIILVNSTRRLCGRFDIVFGNFLVGFFEFIKIVEYDFGSSYCSWKFACFEQIFSVATFVQKILTN